VILKLTLQFSTSYPFIHLFSKEAGKCYEICLKELMRILSYLPDYDEDVEEKGWKAHPQLEVVLINKVKENYSRDRLPRGHKEDVNYKVHFRHLLDVVLRKRVTKLVIGEVNDVRVMRDLVETLNDNTTINYLKVIYLDKHWAIPLLISLKNNHNLKILKL
jgi:hypothetical protein